MAEKLMYIPMMFHKIAPSVDYCKWLKRLGTQLNEPTNQSSLKMPKFVKPTNKKKVIIKLWGLV